MKRARWPVIVAGTALVVALAALGFRVWDRFFRTHEPVYAGKTMAQWVVQLGDPDPATWQAAADQLAAMGSDALPVLDAARKDSDLTLHRRAVAVLVRVGAPAAPGLIAAAAEGAGDRAYTALVRIGPAAVPALVEALADPKTATEAAKVLRMLGPRGEGGIPALLKMVGDATASPGLRVEAAWALGEMGAATPEVVEGLAAALGDKSEEVARRAALALLDLGPKAKAAVPQLARAARDDRGTVAAAACGALGWVGDAGPGAVNALVRALSHHHAYPRADAAGALRGLNPALASIPFIVHLDNLKNEEVVDRVVRIGPSAVPTLTTALGDKEAERRRGAARILGRIGPLAFAATPALLERLKDENADVAAAAAVAVIRVAPDRAADAVALLAKRKHLTADEAGTLGIIGPDAQAAIPALVATLEQDGQEHEPAHSAAVEALIRIGPSAAGSLIDAVRANRPGAARRAAVALAGLGPDAKESIPALRDALKNAGEGGLPFLRALEQIGPAAKDALPEVEAALQEPALKIEAARVLARIDPTQAARAVEVLEAELKPGERGCLAAAVALGDVGPAAKAAVPRLARLIEKRDVAEAVLDTLSRLGPDVKEAIPALLASLKENGRIAGASVCQCLARIGPAAVPPLTQALGHTDSMVRDAAAWTLGRMGPQAKDAVPALVRALKDADRDVRVHAAEALGAMGADSGPAVEALTGLLGTWEAEVRRAAANALGGIGPGAKAAAPALVECLLDPDVFVRGEAVTALAAIGANRTPLRDVLADRSPLREEAAGLLLANGLYVEEATAVLRAMPVTRAMFWAIATPDWPGRDTPEARAGLVAALRMSKPSTQVRAAALLMRDAPLRAEVRAVLMAALTDADGEYRNDRDGDLRRRAADALGEMGPDAKAAAPLLRGVVRDVRPGVRDAATKALKRIDTQPQ